MFRREGISRLEAFSDAVFGFALTLLVVSLETPKTMSALKDQAGSFLPFVLMFAMVTWIWYLHYQFFRRYPLSDAWTVFLNSALLFVILFYVYPLKFLTLALVGHVFMTPGSYPEFEEIEAPIVMVLYSAGIVVVFGCFLLLHLHARAKRVQLDLDETEMLTLKFGMRGHLISMSLGIVSLALVWLIPEFPAWAGIVYGLMGPLHAWNGYSGGTAKAKLEKKLTAAAQAPSTEHQAPSTEH